MMFLSSYAEQAHTYLVLNENHQELLGIFSYGVVKVPLGRLLIPCRIMADDSNQVCSIFIIPNDACPASADISNDNSYRTYVERLGEKSKRIIRLSVEIKTDYYVLYVTAQHITIVLSQQSRSIQDIVWSCDHWSSCVRVEDLSLLLWKVVWWYQQWAFKTSSYHLTHKTPHRTYFFFIGKSQTNLKQQEPERTPPKSSTASVLVVQEQLQQPWQQQQQFCCLVCWCSKKRVSECYHQHQQPFRLSFCC